MSKTNLVAKIEIGFDADEIGRFEWEYDLLEEDEIVEPRSKEELINFVRSEFLDIVLNAANRGNVSDLISIETIG